MKSKRLPFLQSQILNYLYLKIFNKEKFSIEELSSLTGYPKDSKILLNALESLIKKGFISRKDGYEFYIPDSKKTFFAEIIKGIKDQNTTYNEALIDQIDESDAEQLQLFQEYNSISDLNRNNVIHRWYDYLEDFPFSLLEDSIRKYNLKAGDIVLDPFCGSGMFRC